MESGFLPGAPMSRGDYRPIYAVLVDSPEFQALSREGKLLWYALKLSLGPSGIDVLYDDQLAERAGITVAELGPARRELEAGDWLVVEGRVHWLRNGLRFEPTVSLRNSKQKAGIEKHIRGLPKLPIVNEFADHYEIDRPFSEPETEANRKAIERLSKGNRSKEPEPEPEPETEPEPEWGSGSLPGRREPATPVVAEPVRAAPHGQPPTAEANGHPEPPPAGDLFGGHLSSAPPEVRDLLAALKHEGGLKASAATVEHRFLYTDEALADPVVKGLPYPERVRLVTLALLEFATQAEPFSRPLFTGYLRRIRDAEVRQRAATVAPARYEADEDDDAPRASAEEVRRLAEATLGAIKAAPSGPATEAVVQARDAERRRQLEAIRRRA